MPSRFDRAAAITRESLSLAVVPAVATLLSTSNVARALEAGGGGGVTFPFPSGLPTLWTYVSLPGGAGGTPVGGTLALAIVVPLFVFGLVVTSALEAGFLGALDGRLDGRPPDFVGGVRTFTVRVLGVNLVRLGVVLVALPLLVVPPVAVLAVLALSYLLYGLPFEVVARDADVSSAITATVGRAGEGGDYAVFAVGHLVAGAVASLVLSGFVRSAGLPGIAIGAALTAVPAVFVAAYGLLLFGEYGEGGGVSPTGPNRMAPPDAQGPEDSAADDTSDGP